MNIEPLVSVIVPPYNAEKYISQCLDSILAQTYQEIQGLIIGSGGLKTSISTTVWLGIFQLE